MQGQIAHPNRNRLVAFLAVALLPSVGAAAEPAELFATIESVVKANRIAQTKTNGGGKDTYSVTAKKPGALIGFEVGLGRFFDLEIVYALRPIYLNADGETLGGPHGKFEALTKESNKIGTDVTRTVTVKAKPGYGVGGMTVRSGLLINGMSLKFQRIDGSRLDPKDAYESKWIGDRTGGGEVVLETKNMVVVGIHGRDTDRACQSIGLIYLDPAAVPGAPADPKPQPAKK